jgi:hypothetical protein
MIKLTTVSFRSMKRLTRLLTRCWGYLALVIAIAGSSFTAFGWQ